MLFRSPLLPLREGPATHMHDPGQRQAPPQELFVLKENQGKLDSRADEGRWMSYSDESKGHRVYWSGRHCVTIECNITFDTSILTTPGDTQAEGEPATQVTQNNAHVPQPQTPAIDPTHANPPEGLNQQTNHRAEVTECANHQCMCVISLMAHSVALAM